MKVTPVGKKFNGKAPGDVFNLPDPAAKLLIKAGLLAEVVEPDQKRRRYSRRDMAAVDATP